MKIKILLSILFVSSIGYSQNWNPQIIEQPLQGLSHHFGNSVSIDGNYAVIGAPNENNQTGAANVFKKDANGNWNHIQKITAFVGLSEDEYFGSTVHINGDFIFISAPTDRINEVDFEEAAGSVMIYKNNGADNFVGIQRIRSSDIEAGDFFGMSLDSFGDFLVVGAPSEDDDAIGGNRLGAAGSAYIFKKDINDNWNQIQKIVTSHRAIFDNVGETVAIDGDYILLSSNSNTDVDNLNPINGEGSVFVFKKNINDVWSEIQKLKPTNRQVSSLFGKYAIDIDGDFIAVGASNSKNGLNISSGAVHMFKVSNDGNSWNETQELRIAEEFRGDIEFGDNIALKNNHIIISASGDYTTINGQNISNTGSAYVFKLNNDNWSEQLRLESPEPELNAEFGGSRYIATFQSHSVIDFDGNHFIVGNHLKDDEVMGNTQLNVGKAYISSNINTFLVGQTVTWTGAVSTDWNTPGNWDVNAVPTQDDDVILADVANAPRINFNQSYTVKSLLNHEILTIKTNASLTVLEDLDQRNSIIVESFVNGSGSFILRGNQINNAPSNLIYFRYASGNNWHLMSNPTENQDIDVFAAATPLAIGQGNNRGLAFYNENNLQGWTYYQAGANDSGNFTSGKSFALNVSANSFLRFEGTVKDDDLSNYPIVDNPTQWNLVGNPYPAFFNANVNADVNNNFLTENIAQLDPAFANIYLWNPNTNSYDPIGNGLAAKYIAPGQGFFIRSKNGGGTIDINKTMLTHQIGGEFLKQKQPNKIEINLNSETKTSTTTLVFKENMTLGLDVTYDAAVFDGDTNSHYVYSKLLDSSIQHPFAIQFLPEIKTNQFTVPLGIKSDGIKQLHLSFNTEIPANIDIVLEDKKQNTFTKINNIKKYNFNYSLNDELDRFYLHINNKALSIDSFNTENISIYQDKKSSIVINGVENGLLNVYNITGKNVIENRKIKKNKTQVLLPKLAKGVYLFEVKTATNHIVKKLLL